MSPKLTDAKVAEGLGWEYQWHEPVYGPGSTRRCGWYYEKKFMCEIQPRFTTSLDAIVAEIKKRELTWFIESLPNGYSTRVGDVFINGAKAPACLAEALVIFLKARNGR